MTVNKTTNLELSKPQSGDDTVDIFDTTNDNMDLLDTKIVLNGLDASKPASPVVGQTYIATNTDKIYKCITAGAWTLIKNLDLSGNNAADLADITSTGANIEDAVTKKHTQNTDTDLDATFEATIAKKTDKLSAFAATTSAELAGVISDETGTGALMFASANGFASGAKGYKSASDQTIADVTVTKVVLDGEEFDVLNEFDKTTNYRFTATVAGYYLFIGSCLYAPSVDLKTYHCRVHKNNAELQTNVMIASGTEGVSPSTVGIVSLAANDYLELYTYQNSGANAVLKIGQGTTYLVVKRLY